MLYFNVSILWDCDDVESNILVFFFIIFDDYRRLWSCLFIGRPVLAENIIVMYELMQTRYKNVLKIIESVSYEGIASALVVAILTAAATFGWLSPFSDQNNVFCPFYTNTLTDFLVPEFSPSYYLVPACQSLELGIWLKSWVHVYFMHNAVGIIFDVIYSLWNFASHQISWSNLETVYGINLFQWVALLNAGLWYVGIQLITL